MRWKDRVVKDMTSLNIGPTAWYCKAQDRKRWYDVYHAGMCKKIEQCLCKEKAQRQAKRQASLQASAPNVMATPFTCEQCQRKFRRSEETASAGAEEGRREHSQHKSSVKCVQGFADDKVT